MLLGTQRVNAHGHLEIGGCDAVELAQNSGRRCMSWTSRRIRDNCRRYKAAFAARYPKNEISFASKAFLNMAICKVMAQEGLGLDVASAGELYTAIQGRFPAGAHPAARQQQVAAKNCRWRWITASGASSWTTSRNCAMLADLAKQQGKTQRIFLRVTPGIDPHTHRRIRTGQEDTKFGLSIASGAALDAVTEALSYAPHVQITGIHCHIGSQLLDAHTHEQAIDIMVGFLRRIQDATGWTPEDLDIGGGLGIRYRRRPAAADLRRVRRQHRRRPAGGAGQVRRPASRRCWQEPGRALVGEAGTTLYTVGVVKRVPIPEAPGTRTYVAIDGGMSDNPRPQLYDAVYEVLVANKMGEPKTQTVAVAGKHCETDILIQAAQRRRRGPRRHPGRAEHRRVQLRHGVQLQPVHQARLRVRPGRPGRPGLAPRDAGRRGAAGRDPGRLA